MFQIQHKGEPMNAADLINVTPHDINVVTDSGGIINIPRSGHVWRIRTMTVPEKESEAGEIPIVFEYFSGFDYDGLEPEMGKKYIISRPLAAALINERNMEGLLVPGDLVRNDQGQPIGCKCLVRV